MGTNKKKVVVNKKGRPLLYDAKYHPKKVRYLSYLGQNDTQLAAFFEITRETFYAWLKKYPAFSDALYKGRYEDVAQLSRSLSQRAHGYKYKEVKKTITPARIEQQRVPDPDKPGEFKEVDVHLPERVSETIITEKTMPPDVGALRFALANRDRQAWREAQHIDHTTNGKDLPGDAIDLTKLTDDEIEQLARLERKAKGL